MKLKINISVLIVGIIILTNLSVFSQQKDTADTTGSICIESPIYDTNGKKLEYPEVYINLNDPIEEEDDLIFIFVSQMPEFPGGVDALKEYIANHLEYPAVSRENGIEGCVYIRFEVTKTGEIGKIEIQRGVDPLLNDKAIKVIKTLPNFKPGKQNGKAVNVWYSIPITFNLN